MKYLIRTSLVGIVGLGFLFLSPLRSSASEFFSLSVALPAVSLDTTDLDARDAFNRPIRSQSARQSFEQLWMKSLSQLVMNSLTPVRLRLMALLNTRWDGFAGAIRCTAAAKIQTLKAWLQEKKKLAGVHWLSFPFQANVSVNEFLVSPAGNPFLFYLDSVISSTRLLL